jgi:hypothetical protein
MSAMSQRKGRVVNRVRQAIRELNGDAEYARYVRACVERREPPLDRGRYFARRMEERYRNRTGCC